MGYIGPANTGGYMILGHHAFNPLDTTVYCIGPYIDGSPDTVSDHVRIPAPVKCTIKNISLVVTTGTSGSNETSPLEIVVNDSIFHAVGNIKHDAPVAVFSFLNVNIPLAAGDYFYLGWTSPNWGTNPLHMCQKITLNIV